MEELNLSHKKNGETLDCSEWNKLVSVINYIIDFYNAYPTKLSEFENDSKYISENNIIQIIQELIDNGTLPRTQGDDGKSAYELAVEEGFMGTKQQWLSSLQGAVGKSAYELAVENGFSGSVQQWIASLKGEDGTVGSNGQDGQDGITPHIDPFTKHWMIGETDTGIVAEGQDGSDGQDGLNGVDGKSAYQSYVETTNDFPIKTEAQWIASLKGADGINGTNGINGQDGSNGQDGVTPHIDPTTKHWMIGEIDTEVLAEGQNGSDANINTSEFLKTPLLHEYVEIAGIKWATMNVGAESITDAGLYFQWGDTQGYTADQVGSGSEQKAFTWEDYKYGTSASNLTKYNSTDNSNVLEPSDDAVTAAWGSNWRMPTSREWEVLRQAINLEWTNNYQDTGIKGIICIDKTDSSKVLFFPAAGYAGQEEIDGANDTCHYWSNSDVLGSGNAQGVYFGWDDYYRRIDEDWYDNYYKCAGRPVRGILDDNLNQYASKVAVTGNYNDLSNKPTIPAAQIQADWNQTDNTALDYIKNKPTIPTSSGTSTQIQADWDQSDNTALDYIKNKPTIPAAQIQADWSKTDNTALDYIKNKPTRVTHFINDAPYATLNTDIISNNYDYVEIGGVYWATKNVGASSITDNGLYFEFADPNGYTSSQIGVDKNFSKSDSVYYESQALQDQPQWVVMQRDRLNSYQNKIKPQYDGSYANMGGAWKIPDQKEIRALFDNSYLTWYSNYNNSGVSGIEFRNKYRSSNVIFIPYSGYAEDGQIEDQNDIYFWIQNFTDPFYQCGCVHIRGEYISKSMTEGVEFDMNDCRYYSHSWDRIGGSSLFYGMTIRPVLDTSKSIASVAITGDYNDLINKPIIPSGNGGSSLSSEIASENGTTLSAVTTGEKYVWNHKSDFSGSYNDLTNKPTIPTVPGNESASLGGSTLSVVTTGDKYNWNNKASIWSGTQAQYDALSPDYDSNTIYIITASS